MSTRQLLVAVGAALALLVVPSAVADAPSLTVPSSFTQSVDGPGPYTVTYGVSANDADNGTADVSCDHPSGSDFSYGDTLVTCSATDTTDNTVSSDSFTVSVVDTTAPSLTGVPSSFSVEVVGNSSAAVSYATPSASDAGSPVTPSCAPASGSTFAYGATTVTCSVADSRGNTSSQDFTVTLADTVAPTVTPPANISVNAQSTPATVTYANATATEGAAATCLPASGSTFAAGQTTVTCQATDAVGNTGSATFTVTVTDNTPPVITVPAPITVNINNATTATVAYSATAVDGSTSITPSCSPASGSAFPLGATTVTCHATDAAGNTATKTFTVTVADNTPPTVSISGGPAAQSATRSASFDFTASEGTTACQLDGGGFSACSSPVSFSGLADGSHTFTVKATDPAANSATDSRTWTIDATPPVVSVPTTLYVEADGPGGSFVHFNVSASDSGAALLPSAISCDPSNGSLFPIGDTLVTCIAHDSLGNRGSARFGIIVQDTTPPAINAPSVSFTATTATGIAKTDPHVSAYLAGVSASDLVSAPKLTNDMPDVLPIGLTNVTFTAVDAAGNTTARRVTVTVLPVGQKAPPPDFTPPADVAGATAKPGDRSVTITWKRVPADVAYVTVTQAVSGENATGKEIYKGTGATVIAKGLVNGTPYRFLVVAYDAAGNRSKGIALRATPRAEALTSPKPAERVSAPPMLRWAPARGATYFNVQLWRGSTKVLSAWPAANRYQLTATWTFAGKKVRLTSGVYTWYVWPGLGTRAEVRYGGLLGSRTFTYATKKKR
jgi:hypothetical protein